MTDEEYYEFIQPYEDAKQMLLTRLDVLNHNLYGEASARPIHNIQCRIKKKQSIEEKLQRKDKEPTVMNAKDYLQDIAGVRVICYFVDDIYNLTELLKSQSDLIVIKERDYIGNPKQMCIRDSLGNAQYIGRESRAGSDRRGRNTFYNRRSYKAFQ